MEATPQIYMERHPWLGPGTLCPRQAQSSAQKAREKNNAHDTHTAYSDRLDPWSSPGMTAFGTAGNESHNHKARHKGQREEQKSRDP